MMRFLGPVCLLASCFAASAPLEAQVSTGGSVRGYVKDEQDAVLRGVRLTATSADAPGTYTATSDETGYYRLLDLPPAEYTLTAELDGFAKWVREHVAMRAGLNITVPVLMSVGAVNEVVEVVLETPMLETVTASRGVNVSGDLQRAVPLTSRHDWADFMNFVPGVLAQESTRAPLYFVHGSGFQSHVLRIDGADLSATLQSSNTYLNFGTEVMADVQIKTAAVDASSPLGVGAVVNARSRSGTDALRAFVSGSYQPLRWNDHNNPGGTSTTLSVFSPEAAVGGPVKTGRSWFFGAYRYLETVTGVSRTPEQLAILSALSDDFTPEDSRETAHLFFIKSTTQLTGRQQAEIFFQRDVTARRTPTPTATAVFSEERAGGHAYSVRWSASVSDSLLIQSSFAFNDKGAPFRLLRDDVPSRSVHPGAFLSGGRLVGTGAIAVLDNDQLAFDQTPSKGTYAADLTYSQPRAAGSHQVQAGLYVQLARDDMRRRYPANGFSHEEVLLRDPTNPRAGLVPFHRQIFDQAEFVAASDRSRDAAFYVQDLWRPVPRVSISAGVRFDFIRRTDALFEVPVQRSTEIGPRFSINYALTDDVKHTVRASWSRVHDVLSVSRATAGSARVGVRDLYDLDLNGTFETTFATPGATDLASDRLIDLDRNQPFVNEWTFGTQHQVKGGITFDAGVIRRAFRDRTTLVETNGVYEGLEFRGYRQQDLNEIYRLTNNVWNWPVYTGAEFQITKQVERIQLIGSYSRQWRHIAGDWQPNDPGFFIQPGAFANDRGIGSVEGTSSDPAEVSNSLSGRSMAQGARTTSQWQDHVARMGANIHGPWGLSLGLSYVWQTGPWSGPVIMRIASPDPRFGPPTVRLTNGRTVSNPLATPLRFEYPTRGEGQFTLPALHSLNIRIGKRLDFAQRRVEFGGDISNLTNGDADQSLFADSNQSFSPNFKVGRRRQLPRSAQVWFRLSL